MLFRVLLLAVLGLGAASQLSAQLHLTEQDSLAILKQARADLDTLCSDSLAGRGYQNEGHVKAARYIAARFQQLGLQPAGEGYLGSPYLTRFDFRLHRIDSAALAIHGQDLQLGPTFVPVGTSPEAHLNTTLIDLGYGTPPELEGQNWAGKIAVIRSGLPPNHQLPDSLLQYFGNDATKLMILQQLNVAGMLILRSKLTASFAPQPGRFPLIEVADSLWPANAGTGSQATLDVWTKSGQQTSQNVLGLIEGASNSLIVITAHYDHMGQMGSAVFRGANDNASGTTFILSLAKRAKALANAGQLPYSLLFIAFGAEETGLNGSFAYVRGLPNALRKRMKYALNFDLLGNGQNGLVAVGGADYPQLYEPFVEMNQRLQLVPSFRPRGNVPNSDHWPFTQAGIPALFFYTEGGQPWYHDIYDTPQVLELPVFVSFGTLVLHSLLGN